MSIDLRAAKSSGRRIPPTGQPVTGKFHGGFELGRVICPPGWPFNILGLAISNGATPFEVLVAVSIAKRLVPRVRSDWKNRQSGLAPPLILVVPHRGNVVLSGPSRDEPPIYSGDLSRELSIHGVEKTDETGRLCRFNLAVHGLEGEIKHGGNINSFREALAARDRAALGTRILLPVLAGRERGHPPGALHRCRHQLSSLLG